MSVGSGGMGGSRNRRLSFPFPRVGRGRARSGGGRDGAAGPSARRRRSVAAVARRGAAALAVGLLMAAPADTGGAKDIVVPVDGFGALSRGNGAFAWPADVRRRHGGESDLAAVPGRNVGAEFVLARTAHTVTVRRSTGGEVALGRVSLPSPVLGLRYRFLPERRFGAYLGAGIGSPVLRQGTTAKAAEDGAVSGYALGAGMDVRISESWSVTVDAKKVFLDGRATGPGEGVDAREKDSDPWVFGLGLGFLF